MSDIAYKTIKELWGKAACRCSICNKKLILDDLSHACIGEQCHIISKKPNGPRHKEGISNYDEYDNLILLCRNHHKEIDDNPIKYSIEKLKQIKDNHEKRVNKLLKKEGHSIEIAFKVSTGEELGSMLWGCHVYRVFHESGSPRLLNLEEEISETIGNMLDLQENITLEDKRNLYKELDLLIQDFKSVNVSVYACIVKDSINGIPTSTIILYFGNSYSSNFIVVEYGN